MDIRARDIMVTEFDTIKSSDTVQEAVKLMKFDTDNPKRRRIFGIMVTNDAGELAGMISMYDILFHVRPPFMNAWEKNAGLSWHGQFNAACLKAKNLKIGDIMTTSMVKVDENAHITDVIDIMVKKHIRRIPVLRGKQILGIIYISEVFYEVYKQLVG